ncbi:hypothetical protein G9A89_006780 [Geosiphon pyriformis]|nr:hypothetical protein G9A89_006780 [Geosiphon pyriformis]
MTYANKDKRKLQTPAVTPQRIQPPIWKKHRIKLPTNPSYHYISGSIINITATDIQQNPNLENPEIETPNFQIQHNPNDQNPNINNQQHLPPVIVINLPPAPPINKQQQQPLQSPQLPQQPQQQLQQPLQSNLDPMAYAPIAKLKKFTSKKDDVQVWLNDVEKAIAANGWNDARAMQVIPYFLQNTTNSCSILQCIYPMHPVDLQAAVTNARDFEAAELEANHTQTQLEEHFAAYNRNNLDFIELNPLPSCLICFPLEEQSSRQFQDFWNWFLNEHSAETYTAYTTYYFDQAYFENNFKEKNNSINQLLYSATFEQQPPDFEYLNHQIHILIVVHQATETPFETEEESYQTAPVFDLLSSKSDLSTQTVTPEPMANDLMQANILATLQSIQTALGRRNNTLLLLFRGDAQDPIEWLDNFERAATANQYDEEYKFQIVSGYLQGSSATWFSQETNANAQHKIIR